MSIGGMTDWHIVRGKAAVGARSCGDAAIGLQHGCPLIIISGCLHIYMYILYNVYGGGGADARGVQWPYSVAA